MNESNKFHLNRLMDDCRNTPVTHPVADHRHGVLIGYIDCLLDCGVISRSEAETLRDEALYAYTFGAAA